MSIRFFIGICCLLLSHISIGQQQTIQVKENDHYLIGAQIQFYVDTTGSLTANEALLQSFTPSDQDIINLSLTPFVLWMRFAVENATSQPILLEIGEPNLETIEVYQIENGQPQAIYQGGFDEAFSQRPIENNKWLFELDLAQNQKQEYLIKAQSGYPLKVPVSLSTKNQYIEYSGRAYIYWGIYLGILLFAFFYNLFLFLSIRESMYLYYCLYVLCGMGFYGGIVGLNFRFLWPDLAVINYYLPVLISLMNLFVFLFTLQFLKITKTQRIAYYGGWFFVGLYLLAAVICLFGRYDIAVVMTQMLSVLMSFYYVYIVIDALRKKIPNAKYFALAWLQFIFLLVIFILTDNGVLPTNTFTLHSLFIGNALEVLLLSFALAARINFMKKDNARKQQEIIYQLEENDRIQRKANEELEQKVEERTAEVVAQKNEAVKQRNRSDELLLNILPEETAEELKTTGKAAAKLYDSVTVMFVDMASFTTKSEKLTPQELVEEVNELFTEFDKIVDKYGIEKIKTIGDAYMAVAGLPTINKDHALLMTKAAFEMQAYVQERFKKQQAAGADAFEIRIGLHSGPVVAGVVGLKKFAYDIWGSTVNIANRMEGNSEVNRINVSKSTYDLIKGQFKCTPRGQIEAKGIGAVEMYFVDEPKS